MQSITNEDSTMPQKPDIYYNSRELENGQLLEIRWVSEFYGTSHPDNCDSEISFRLDGFTVERDELPAEVTAEVIAELVNSAKRLREGDLDEPITDA
jgi:hypothetical protein